MKHPTVPVASFDSRCVRYYIVLFFSIFIVQIASLLSRHTYSHNHPSSCRASSSPS